LTPIIINIDLKEKSDIFYMFRMFKNLEIEWKIILAATIIIFTFAIPFQYFNVNKLHSTLNQSTDPQLESLLRSFITKDNDSLNQQIIVSLERNRQWQALIPYIIEEQSYALFFIALAIFIILISFSIWSLKWLTRPLKKLAVAADEIGKGNNISITPKEGGALGRLEHAMVSMQNELVKLRERAHTQGMESAWRDIARVMAHEIKNPLTPIQLTLDRIQDRFDNNAELSPDEMLKFVHRIGTQVSTLERLVNDFRSFAKEPEPIFTLVSLRDAVDEISSVMENSIKTVLIGNTSIQADPHLLNRVLLNIWKNSFEAGATIINATITQDSLSASLTIKDNGSGVPAENLERIWIPYVTFKKGGTGLGLPVVKRLLESMNATISMTSSCKEQDHGVTTIITFTRDTLFADTAKSITTCA